jgi:hypothetical protein
LTAEDRAMLVESPKLFSHADIDGFYANHRIFWMDEKRLIMSVRRLGEWRAQERELSKIVILHADTLRLEETAYRGSLECYLPEKMVIYPQPIRWTDRHGKYLDPGIEKRYQVQTGRFGETLQFGDHPGFEIDFNRFTCRAFNFNADSPANEDYFVHPLRDGEGMLGYTKLSPKNLRRQQLALFDEQGKIYAELWIAPGGSQKPLGTNEKIQYNSSTKRYFIASADSGGDITPGSAVMNPSVSFQPGKGFEEHDSPPLMASFMDKSVLSLHKFDTAAGIVYAAARRINYEAYRGLFIQRGDKTHRFMDADFGFTSVPISPSGCRFMIAYTFKDTYRSGDKREIFRYRIFDVCQGERK